MSAYEDELMDWANLPDTKVTVPPIRTFRVIRAGGVAVCLEAHSLTCEGDVAKFYAYRIDRVDGVHVLVAYCVRVLRPYLDIEDVTAIFAVTSSKELN